MKEIPGSVYDYLLFYECAASDWMPGKNSQKLNIAQNAPGTLVNNINWHVGGTTVKGDAGGNTKCGIIASTWRGFYNSNAKRYGLNCGPNVDYMDKKGWLSYIDYKWPTAANVACELIYFQWCWGSGSCKSKNLVKALRDRADKSGWSPKNGGDIGSQVLDATYGFNNPMDAYQIIRDYRIQFLWDISTKEYDARNGRSNAQFRTGWLRRTIGSFQDDGLYLAEANELYNIPYNTPIPERKSICNQLKGKGSYVRLCSWDNMPTNPEAFIDVDVSDYTSGGGGYSGGGGGGSFGGGNTNYSPKFSAAADRDPHLRASKEVVLKKGILLGSEFEVK